MPLFATGGDDSIPGTVDDDSLFGLGGNDTLDGGTGGVDTLHGDGGNDLIWTRGDDLAFGDDGNDIIAVNGEATGTLDGGIGDDTLRFEGGYDISGATLTGIETAAIAGTAIMTAAQLAQFTLVTGYNPAYTSAGVTLAQGGTAVVNLSTTLTNYFSLTGSGSNDNITFNATHPSMIYAYMGLGNDKVTTAAGNDSIRGEEGNDTLSGLVGDDSIDGGLGHDSMLGGDGNDTLLVNGNDSALGGAGLDFIAIGGNGAAVLNGGSGQDTLRFDSTYDISGATLSQIESLFASSNAMMTAAQLDQFTSVSGYASNYATAGVTLTQGGTANLTLSATLSTSFSLQGSAQADIITFAAGYNALIYGYMGAGNDSLIASNGGDSLRGEAGNDTLLGMAGADSMDGGLGFDRLEGGLGNDLIFAGIGDTVLAGQNDDLVAVTASHVALLDGGFGNDTLRFETSYDISDTTLTGFEQLNLNGTVMMTTAQLDLFTAVGGYSPAYTTATVVLTKGGVADINVLLSVSGYFSLTGSSEAESLTFDPAYTNMIYAYLGGGNDSLISGFGNDSIRGDDGDDTLYGMNGNDSIDGGIGADSIDGGNGSDLLYARYFDSVLGGNGDDLISVQENMPAVLLGGIGDDTLRFEAGYDITGATIGGFEHLNVNGNVFMTAAQLDLFGTVAGYAPGYTTAQISLTEGGTASVALDPTLTSYFYLTGSGDNDTISVNTGYLGIFYGYMGAGNDSLTGGSGNDSLRGDEGDDTFNGGNGNDSIDGGTGNDFLFGGAGNDTIDGGWGIDSIDGGAGNDLLLARVGDSVYGGGNDDIISVTESLPAWLDAGTGSDTLRAESSYDITGTKLIGFERLNINGTLSMGASQLNSFAVVGGYAPGYTTANVRLTVGGTATINLDAGLTAYFQLFGSAQDDKITFNSGYTSTIYAYGGYGNDLFSAGSGQDSLRGEQGNDTLNGLGGNDTMDGGAGADVLTGGLGIDTMTGGTGQDLFVFSTVSASDPANPDRIVDFEGAGAVKGDMIDVSGIDADGGLGAQDSFLFNNTGLAGLSLIDSGTDTLVRLNTDNDAAFEVIILIADGAVLAATYTAADFNL